MRKELFAAMLAVLVLAGCEKGESEMSEMDPSTETAQTKKFVFTVKGDWSKSTMKTPAKAGETLRADDKEMTDLWVLDYMDGVLVQQLHQTPTDDAWGIPSLSLKYGEHHIYFIASRGESPLLNTEIGTITWGTVRDTFWKDYAVEVKQSSNGNRSVTLDRVVTRARFTIQDAIPDDVTSIFLTADRWYKGMNYRTGAMAEPVSLNSEISIPDSYHGTTGRSIVVYSLSGAASWSANMTLTARNSTNEDIYSVSLAEVPFERNRTTTCSGRMFSAGTTTTVTLDSEWGTDIQYEW